MDITALLAMRLQNQGITTADFTEPAAVASHLLAIQAQDYPGALWSVGLRLAQGTQSVVEAAISQREIIRTWPMRGTLHFVAADDIRWLLQLLTPRIISGAASRRRNLELDEMVFAKAEAVLRRQLEGGKIITRTELCAALDGSGIVTAGQRGIHILSYLSMTGVLCFGPHQAKQPTFVLLDEWLPTTRQLSEEEAWLELTRRFFVGHGPATLSDLARWAGAPLTPLRQAVSKLNSELESIQFENQTYWFSRNTPQPRPLHNSVILLPGFDEYVLGYKDRSLMLETAHSQKIVPGNNGMFLPTVVVDGTLAGLWQRSVKKDGLHLEVSLFNSLNAKQWDALEEYAQRLGVFLDTTVTVHRQSSE